MLHKNYRANFLLTVLAQYHFYSIESLKIILLIYLTKPKTFHLHNWVIK